MFVVCGEALWDMFAVEDAAGLRFDARIGGSPFNVAVGMARQGARASLFTGLSTDRLGARLAAALAREGVSDAHLVRLPNRTTLSLVDIAEDGGPSYVFYGDGAADRAVSTPPALGDDVWGLHAGSFSLVVQPVGGVLEQVFAAQAGKRLLTLDPNVRLNVEPDVDAWQATVARFAAHADLIKVSAEDLELLWPGQAPEAIALRWREAGAALVIVTDGAKGATAWGRFGTAHAPGRRVAVKDTVGAGDTFMATVIAGLERRGATARDALLAMEAEDAADLLAEAAAAAAITCSRTGADLPTLEEIRAAG